MNSYSRKVSTITKPVTDKYSFEQRSVAGGYLLLAGLIVVAGLVVHWIIILS